MRDKSSATLGEPGTYNDDVGRDSMSDLCTLLESVIHKTHPEHITGQERYRLCVRSVLRNDESPSIPTEVRDERLRLGPLHDG